jgi:hypothetical protein
MKVFVATKETQTEITVMLRRDFSYVPEGELVMPIFAWEYLNVCDPGAPRSLGGTKTKRATTTFKVVEQKITGKDLEETFLQSLKDQGFVSWKMLRYANNEQAWRNIARSFARAIMRAASKFPAGDVVEKNGCVYASRTHQKLKVKVLVRKPRDL